ncbi:MAG TPA: DNA topoisomerase IB [Bacteroidia bacterium]|nr:DNA topoisomerase IB [Bacteroidia bacterium]
MYALPNELTHLSAAEISTLVKDAVKSAEAVNLVYVTDTLPGIKRVKKGKGFCYYYENKKITDEEQLKRIRKLVIPPAWKQVWICSVENGHLQATGLDARQRKQYKYHPLWNTLRNHTKFHRLYEFGEALPAIRQQLERDLSLPGLQHDKILALVVSLMERTSIRVGNSEYEKLYGSFGLTTLKDKHVTFNGTRINFQFRGKKGVHQNVSIKSRKLAYLVKKCRDIPGKELFQFVDENSARHAVDSGMVNEYIKKISGHDFTAKDFRTWTGTIQALIAFRELGRPETQTAIKKKVVEALDMVSVHLGNTRTVCKKYYVHPLVVALYEDEGLDDYFSELNEIEVDDGKAGLAAEEKILMKILERKT